MEFYDARQRLETPIDWKKVAIVAFFQKHERGARISTLSVVVHHNKSLDKHQDLFQSLIYFFLRKGYYPLCNRN